MSHGKKKKMPSLEEHLDLVPLIDCVFLLLLFFMLCGRLSSDQRTEQITVPPTKTANKATQPTGWERIVLNVFGNTYTGKPPTGSIGLGGAPPFQTQGPNDYSAYQKLRRALDAAYDRAEKYPDPNGTGMMLPKVIVEVRADADTEYRVVQEVQQILSDTIDPNNKMLGRNVLPTQLRCFVNLEFTTRRPGEQ